MQYIVFKMDIRYFILLFTIILIILLTYMVTRNKYKNSFTLTVYDDACPYPMHDTHTNINFINKFTQKIESGKDEHFMNMHHELFKAPARNIKAACLFVGYNLDKDDYEFVKKYHKEIAFYVVNNGEVSKWAEKIMKLKNIKFLIRDNTGWDTYAWRDGLFKWFNVLKNYDVVGLINNSCIYGVDMLKLYANAMDYDMYGIGYSIRDIRFLQSYCILINHRLFNDPEFMLYWENLPNINTHISAVFGHEFKFTSYFEKLGYRVSGWEIGYGTKLITDNPGKYHRFNFKRDKFNYEIIKKKVIKKYGDEERKKFEKGLRVNARQKYI